MNLLFAKRFYWIIILFLFSVESEISAQSNEIPNFNILITEIFADPTPSHGLPEKEYIELYNNTSGTINLKGFTLFYANTSVTFPAFDFSANTYLIVCRVGNGTSFEPYGPVVELSKFSLLNTGSLLMLRNASNQLVFEINYQDKWYSEGRDQGYSLEMIDFNYPCIDAKNWTSTSDDSGGTPGKVNAATATLPDVTPPVLTTINQISDNEVELIFDEKLAYSISDFQIESVDKEIEIDSIKRITETSVLFKIKSTIENDVFYDFKIHNLADCSGNVSAPISFSIGNASPADSADVLISEILFNPGTGGDDFVEIINGSNRIQNLRKWSLANKDENGKAINLKPISLADLLMQPDEIFCFTIDKNKLLSFYPESIISQIIEIGALPSFSNSAGTVALLDATGKIIDSFSYSESMQNANLDVVDGVSLERKDLNISASVPENWQSVSSTYGYATPGFRPVYTVDANAGLQMILSTQVITPDGDGQNDDLKIEIQNLNYSALASLDIYNANGAFVSKLWNNQYISGLASTSWAALDASGKLLPTGPYIIHAVLNINNQIIELTDKVVIGFSK